MDFSTPERGLESILRRQPRIEQEGVLEWCDKMLRNNENHLAGVLFLLKEENDNGDENNNDGTTATTKTTMRWEQLAVGLHVGTDLLQQQIKAKQAADTTATKKEVYVEGPRVPTMPSSSSSSSSSETTATSSTTSTTAAVRSLSTEEVESLCETLHASCVRHLEHSEPRIRTLVAKAVGAQVTWAFIGNTEKSTTKDNALQMHSILIRSIEEHIQTGRDTGVIVDKEQQTEQRDNPKEKQTKQQPLSVVLDDTTGWRALETNWQCLACWIQACMEHYVYLFLENDNGNKEFTTTLFQNLRFSAIDHVNRHVRAAGMLVLEHLIRSVTVAATSKTDDTNNYHLLLTSKTSLLRKTLIQVLKHGLADNWSQVRMAASVLCREFLLHMQQLEQQQQLDDRTNNKDWAHLLIPRMCLNRFYLAQGVKLFSHETWRLVFGDNGLQRVLDTIGPTVRYYIKMCDADNHVVREGACQAVAELVTKGGDSNSNRELLQPYISMLLQALIMCFHDESWPVRDEACLACGTFCKAYPDECAVELETLWERWTEQLTDQIWSVRQDAAVALGDAIEAYKEPMLQRVLGLVTKLLPSAKDQPPMSYEEYKRKQNDIDSHSDLQLYSCGSLAPKLGKGKKSGAGRIGCSSCLITRPKAPWEATDGCIYLLRELCVKCIAPNNNVSSHTTTATPIITDEVLLPLMTECADVCRVQHFPQGDDLRMTLWKQLPVIATHIGKQRFKRLYLELFLDLLMSNLQRSTASELSKHAAGQCLEELANFLGPNIVRGRVANLCISEYEQIYDSILQGRHQMMDPLYSNGYGNDTMMMMNNGGGVSNGYGAPQPYPVDTNHGFSPFGPPWLLDSISRNQQ